MTEVYCRYEGEHSEKYLERSRLNMTSGLNQGIGGERGGEGIRGRKERVVKRGQEEKPWAKKPRISQEPKHCVPKMAWLPRD